MGNLFLGELKDSKGNLLTIGDKVRILKFTDDSGEATDMYGVEPQLNAWVEIIYIEDFEGIITYNLDKMMVVIKNKNREIPLASYIRDVLWDNMYDRIPPKDLEEIKNEYDLPDIKYETIIDYIVKL